MELEELFESYLGGKMNQSDKDLFEKLLEENPNYKIQLESYRIEFDTKLKTQSDAGTTSSVKLSNINPLKTWSISIGIAFGIVLAGYFLLKTLSMSPGEKLYFTYYDPSPNLSAQVKAENPLVTQAISVYENREYEQAIGLLEEQVIQRESDLVHFYLGLSQLGNKRPEKGIPTLSLVSDKAEFYLEANWYIAMGYLKLNKLEEAKKHLEISASQSNPYTEEAKEILQKMK